MYTHIHVHYYIPQNSHFILESQQLCLSRVSHIQLLHSHWTCTKHTGNIS